MTEKEISLTVNGTERELHVEPRTLLVHAIREELDLTGTHIGCDTGNCGACTIYQDGQAVKSCLQFAVQADGTDVTTVEGMEDTEEAGMGNSDLHPLQEGFHEMHGLQCGFCTPGMIMAGKALLEGNQDPTETEIRENISGNLCRCTGYQNIVKSIEYAADVLNDREPPESPVENRGSAMDAQAEPASDGGRRMDEPRGGGNPLTDGGGDARSGGDTPGGGGCGCGSGPDLGCDYPTGGGDDE